MAFSCESIEQMMARMYFEELAVLESMGVKMAVCCPYAPPTRWQRFKDDVLTFCGWR